jgi:hypothetical protein
MRKEGEGEGEGVKFTMGKGRKGQDLEDLQATRLGGG